MAALHAACFPDRPWSAHEFTTLLKQNTVLFAADPERRGFILLRTVAEEAEILTLAVSPAARRKGVARNLVANMFTTCAAQGCTDIFLEVAADNTAAIGLYAGLGFDEVGRRPGYYGRTSAPSADAIIMRRRLAQKPDDNRSATGL